MAGTIAGEDCSESFKCCLSCHRGDQCRWLWLSNLWCDLWAWRVFLGLVFHMESDSWRREETKRGWDRLYKASAKLRSLYGLQSHQLSKEIAREPYFPLAERSLQFNSQVFHANAILMALFYRDPYRVSDWLLLVGAILKPSPGQMITTCRRNLLQYCWRNMLARLVTMLRGVASCWMLLQMSQKHPTCRNREPGGQTRATMLRYKIIWFYQLSW